MTAGTAAHALCVASDDMPVATIVAILSLPVLTVAIGDHLGAYRLETLRALPAAVRRIASGWAIAMVVLLASAFAANFDEMSRSWFGFWLIAGTVGLVGVRLAAATVTRRWTAAGLLDRRAVVVGGGQAASDLIRALEASPSANVRIMGVFDDRGADRAGHLAHYPVLGTFDDLVAFAREHRVDTLILALPLTAEARLLQLLAKLWVLPVDIRISALSSRLRFRPRAYSYIGDVPFLDVFDRPLSSSDAVVKNVFDRVVGAVLLAVLSPIMALTALAVRLDSPGQALFKQKRYGFNNELIEVYKFRSMYVDQADAGAARLVTKGDPRVTRVGRFIRKTSLDELPQLFNVVFKGNLSLVGPRPHAVHAKAADALYQDVVDGYFARHKVKPGITGWAQINGWRGETDTADKIQHRVSCDLHYIENWSPLFDLTILAMTPVSLLTKSESAY
jgi:Undecaprenyl-phosphate glucose phosphotransferase